MTSQAMISRHWKGTVKPGYAERYLEHLRTHTLPQLTAIAGFVSVAILKRDVGNGTEFQIVTVWTSIESIRAFAGDDAELAVVPPAAQALMATFDRRAVHYEVVEFASA
jgi:heme-degrading monooxygenase HmoA